MKLPIRQLLFLGILAEVAIFILAYLTQISIEESFRHAARYSGRLSLGVFLITFYTFAFSHPKPLKENNTLQNWLKLFALVHVIHFGFLAANVYLNNIPIVPIKLLGGFLAYVMIIIAPFLLHKLKLSIQLVYFYYVCLVMTITYIARVKGDFEGAEPFWFHFLALGVLISSALFLGWKIYSASRNKSS